MKVSLFIVFAVVLPAMFLDFAKAQDMPKPETPAPAAPTKFVLEFDQNDITTLNMCVGELPYKQAQPFVTKMNAQMAPQLKPKAN